MYRFGTGLAVLFLFIVVTAIVSILLQVAYETTMRLRFRHLLQDETLSAIKTSAQNRTGVHLADEIWLRSGSRYFVIPMTTLLGNAIVMSYKAVELLKAKPEKAEIILADRLFRLKASDARLRLVLTTAVCTGAYLIAAVLVSWLGIGSWSYLPANFMLLTGFPLLAAASILGLLVIGPAVWSDNPGKAIVREIYGVFAVVAENELVIGRPLTPDETNAVIDRARRDELSKRAERRSIISLLSAALAIVPALLTTSLLLLFYYMYILSIIILVGVPVGVLFVLMTALYLWDRKCTRQNWGFTSETHEPIWMD